MATCQQLQNDYDRDTNILDTANPQSSEYRATEIRDEIIKTLKFSFFSVHLL